MAQYRPPQQRMPSEGEARDLAKQLVRVGSRSGPTREARGNGREGRSDSRAWRIGGGRPSRRD
jgi:hypothetical protein